MQPVISAKLFQKSTQVIIIIWHSSIDETTIAQDLYQDMRGSRNFRQGGSRSGPSVIKIPDNVFIVLFLVVLHLFYRMPIVYFKENYNFPRFQRGLEHFFQGGTNFF